MDLSLLVAVRLIHLVAVTLAVGAATAKNLLLLRCRKDSGFVLVFLKVEKLVTAQIITGQVLLTLSGIAYALLLGYGFTPRVTIKVVLLAVLWVVGPIIDNVISPPLRKLAPAPGESGSPEFVRALNRYLRWDLVATGIYYVIIVLWVTMG